ncbi:CLUMA_CG016932, isoform A [Clunio marinus]|uniref:CLUMA_CG016932, isoform A n=1 Tax=Clunio marinus TaxID=568069 RepID=A0A1J1ITJ3_9DIPT|nr:CLUMA_CG016932, isoform A [Clunio marinus]
MLEYISKNRQIAFSIIFVDFHESSSNSEINLVLLSDLIGECLTLVSTTRGPQQKMKKENSF